MKVAYITAGAAGMYCGSCMRDNTLVRALRSLGVEGVLVPTYTPIRTDVEDVSESRVFLGGIGVYLSQRFAWWRRSPRFLSRWLAAPALLRAMSRLSVKNRPGQLGELTLSILRGEEGNQRREVEELCEWLRATVRPDIVHLTNSMFAGLAPILRRRLDVPILCTLQGEDLFLEGLPEPYRSQTLERIGECAASIDCFVAVSEYYRRFMSDYLRISPERIAVVRPGIPREVQEALGRSAPSGNGVGDGEVAIGYLARICQEKGAGLLAEAFKRLRERPGMERVRLRLAGYLGPADRVFVENLRADLAREGLAGAVEILGTLDYAQKLRFFSEIDIFSVPAVYREPKGLYVLEAFARGLPAVLPRHGAFEELIETTGGGILVDPDSPASLAEGLERLIRDEALRRELGRKAAAGVSEGYTDRQMAEATLEIYRRFSSSVSIRQANSESAGEIQSG